eukprot:scaffold59684_cov19-Tisochrysis_lutea.AAC.1
MAETIEGPNQQDELATWRLAGVRSISLCKKRAQNKSAQINIGGQNQALLCISGVRSIRMRKKRVQNEKRPDQHLRANSSPAVHFRSHVYLHAQAEGTTRTESSCLAGRLRTYSARARRGSSQHCEQLLSRMLAYT